MLLAREHGLKEVWLWALTNHAAALSQSGRAEEGLGEIRSYLKTALQIGSRINRAEGVARLAQCLIALGRYDEAFEAAIECIQSDVANGERFYESELYRVSAECCFRRAEYEDAKARFRRALEIAQKMQARAWELRAAIGLAHGKRDTSRKRISFSHRSTPGTPKASRRGISGRRRPCSTSWPLRNDIRRPDAERNGGQAAVAARAIMAVRTGRLRRIRKLKPGAVR